MMNQAGRGPPPPQGREEQPGMGPIAHGPGHNPPRVPVEEDGEVDPASPRGHPGDISHPHLILDEVR